MDEVPETRPDWNRLFETAAAQEGLFTTKQAAEAGYSPQLLVHYVLTGKAHRVRRGTYRLVHFPAGEHEELVAAWLWSERAGVVSHQTALVPPRALGRAPGARASDPSGRLAAPPLQGAGRCLTPPRERPNRGSHLVRGGAHDQPSALAERLRTRGPVARVAPTSSAASSAARPRHEGRACRGRASAQAEFGGLAA
jgi:hypothetical protein